MIVKFHVKFMFSESLFWGETVKVKIIGFKVGATRPTYNKTMNLENDVAFALLAKNERHYVLGKEVYKALVKSDFLSIRKV